MLSSHYAHVIKIVVGLGVVAVLGLVGKIALTPKSFGTYGHYRADAIDEEAQTGVRHWTNASCFSCHPYEAGLHAKGHHKTISCEFCHGPYADHIENGKKTGVLPVLKDDEITRLCLRCHNKAIEARPESVIKTVTMPEHLFEQRVKLSHTCNQCHHVHAPLEYINRAKQIVGMTEGS